MSDNLKEKTNKFIDKSVDTTREAAQTIHNDAKMKAPKISGEGKTGVHKAVSNAKIAVHGAGPA
jgi:hypothetical protein